MRGKIEITNDVFDIARRIKEIDGDYFVVYDARLDRFEVHNRRQRPDTLSLVLPYNTLDCRAIDKVLSTRAERVAALLAEMDRANEKLAEARGREIVDRRMEEGREILDRLSR